MGAIDTSLNPMDSALACTAEGTFRIVQFNDTQDDHLTDRRTLQLMEAVLDREQPNLVIINGDIIDGGPNTADEVRQAINNVVQPMESRGIPWAVTFGNHEEDSHATSGTGMLRPELLDFIRRYPRNLNPAAVDGVHGYTNAWLPISHNDEVIFAVWLLDSGSYAPARVHGQSVRMLPAYDYLRPSQIQWYRDTSQAVEHEHGRKVPSLMFFHIPTYEHLDMWNGGPGATSEQEHQVAVDTFFITGEKLDTVAFGALNSGIYAACQERGDVRGIYCGHNHLNSYTGNYYGIELGFSPATGFAPYGAPGQERNHHRGARVFELEARDSRIYTGTRVLFARDLGVDVSPGWQPIERPLELPE